MTGRILFTCITALACGCTEVVPDEESSPTAEPPQEVALDEITEQPGPTSRLVDDVVAMPRRTAQQAVRERLSLIARDQRVVVVGRVKSLRAERRTLGNAEASITTRATIAIADQLCGDRVGATVEIVYAGGRIGDTAEYTSQMSRDLARDSSHVFVLRRLAGELVLEMGTDDLVTAPITTAQWKEACQ